MTSASRLLSQDLGPRVRVQELGFAVPVIPVDGEQSVLVPHEHVLTSTRWSTNGISELMWTFRVDSRHLLQTTHAPAASRTAARRPYRRTTCIIKSINSAALVFQTTLTGTRQ